MVLIAEDDVDYTFLIQRALREAHPELPYLMFKGGEEVIDYVQGALSHGRIPSLVITDISMPRKNGFQVLQEIKANILLKDVPVVVMSSSNSTADRETASTLGADAYFVKNETYKGIKGDLTTIITQYRKPFKR